MEVNTKPSVLNDHEIELFELLNDNLIVSITDAYGRIIYANDRFCNIMGSHKSNIIGETHELLKSHLHTDVLYKNLWKTITSGNTWKGVLPNKLINGKFYWLETTITPIRNENGNISKYLAVYNDITGYYNNNKKLKTDNPDVKIASKDFSNVTLSINSSGKILNAKNRAFKTTDDDLIGLYIYDIINPLSHNKVKKHIKKVFSDKGVSELETIELPINGQQTFYVSEFNPEFNTQNNLLSVAISTKKQKKEFKIKKELRHIEAKYSTIFQSINVGILVVTDGKGNIIEWNKGAELAFGYSEDEVIGNPLTKLISKHHLITSVKELLKAKNLLNKNHNSENLEMIGLKKNGEEFPVEFAISTWEEGNERFYCAMMLDITNRKKLETKLKQKTEDLEMFLYRSAHDLKAPLTSAEGLLNLIKEENLDSNAKLLTDLLYKTLERGRLLVDNIAYASIIPNKANEINKIDFNALIENTLKTLSGLKNYEAIKFDLNLEQVDGFYANQELISSLFQNIIHNAIKYSKPLSTNHVPFVTIQISQLDGFVKIVIQDNGIGMDETHLKRVFDLYYRINEDYEQGSGLGLYIVKRIVDDLNGKIIVTSKINEGTSFEVILPNLKEGELNDD